MTDHLEPYRRLVRAIRFVPPILHAHQRYQHLVEPFLTTFQPTPAPIAPRPERPDPGPPVDPSAHAAQLIQAAVSKPTVLPTTYSIPESIGDRISRLSNTRPICPDVPAPKIPQPDPNWTPSSAAEPVVDAPSAGLALSAPESSLPSEARNEPPQPEHPNPPIEEASTWAGSVTEYLESVTQTLEEAKQPPVAHHEATVDCCPKCHSQDLRRNGRRGGKQKYLCKRCGRQFTGNQPETIGFTAAIKGRGRKQAKGFG